MIPAVASVSRNAADLHIAFAAVLVPVSLRRRVIVLALVVKRVISALTAERGGHGEGPALRGRSKTG